MANWVLSYAALRLPLTYSHLKEFAARIAARGGDYKPIGNYQVEGFLHRNPEIRTVRGKRLDSKRMNRARYAINTD